MTIDNDVNEEVFTFLKHGEEPACYTNVEAAKAEFDDPETEGTNLSERLLVVEMCGKVYAMDTDEGEPIRTWLDLFNCFVRSGTRSKKFASAKYVALCIDKTVKNEERILTGEQRSTEVFNGRMTILPEEDPDIDTYPLDDPNAFPYMNAHQVRFRDAWSGGGLRWKEKFLFPLMIRMFKMHQHQFDYTVILCGFSPKPILITESRPPPFSIDDWLYVPTEADCSAMSFILRAMLLGLQCVCDMADGDFFTIAMLAIDYLYECRKDIEPKLNQLWWTRHVKTNSLYMCMPKAYSILWGIVKNNTETPWVGVMIAWLAMIKNNDYVNLKRDENRVSWISLELFMRQLRNNGDLKNMVYIANVEGYAMLEINTLALMKMINNSRGESTKKKKPDSDKKPRKPPLVKDGQLRLLARQMLRCTIYFMLEPRRAFEELYIPPMTQEIDGVSFYGFKRYNHHSDMETTTMLCSKDMNQIDATPHDLGKIILKRKREENEEEIAVVEEQPIPEKRIKSAPRVYSDPIFCRDQLLQDHFELLFYCNELSCVYKQEDFEVLEVF